MSTVAQVINRINRDFFRRPNDQPVLTRLTTSLTDSQQTFAVELVDLDPEELNLIRAGTIIEVDSELMRVINFDADTGDLTVARGQEGTTAVTHADGAYAIVAPAITRQAIFEAVQNAVSGLYPDLFTTATDLVFSEAIAWVPDRRYTDVITAVDLIGEPINVRFQIGYEESESGKVVLFPRETWGQDTWVTFKKPCDRPTSEADDLSDLGVLPEWEDVLVISAVEALPRGREIDLQTLEYLTEALEAAGQPAGRVTDVATAFLRYREYLISRHRRKLDVDMPVRVQMNRVI